MIQLLSLLSNDLHCGGSKKNSKKKENLLQLLTAFCVLLVFPSHVSGQTCVASAGEYCPQSTGQPIPCSPGFYCLGGALGVMTPCPINTYNANAGGNALTSCSACAKRYVTSGTGFTSCSYCPAGTSYGDNGAAAAPFEGHCTACASGTSSVINSDACSSCLVGSYSDAVTKTCSICRPGTYQDIPGASSCNICPDGTYTYTANVTASGASVFLPLWGATSVQQCNNLPTFGAPLVCLPGTYMNSGNCLPCPIGYYCPSMQIAANDPSAIRICPQGKMSKKQGAITSNDCTEVSLLQDYKFSNCNVANGDTQVLDPKVVTSSVTSKSTGTLYFTTATAIYRVYLQKSVSTLDQLAGVEGTAATGGDVSNGVGSAVKFTSLTAIGVDYDAKEATVVVVADGNAIRMVDIFTKKVTLLGSKGDVHQVGGIALQKDGQGSKKAYVTDTTYNRIMVFDLQTLQSNLVAGSINGIAGSSDASFSAATFRSPKGLAFLEKNMNSARMLLVADSGNGKIRVIDTQSRDVKTWFAPLDKISPELTSPTSISVAFTSTDSTSTPLVYVVDAENVKVIQFPQPSDSTIKVISSLSLSTGVEFKFQNAIPYGASTTSNYNNVAQVGFPNLIVLDAVNHKIKAFVEQVSIGNAATCHLTCENTNCGDLQPAQLCGNAFLDPGEQCDDGGANLGGCDISTCTINNNYACPSQAASCLNPCPAYHYAAAPAGTNGNYCSPDCLTLTPRKGFTIDKQCIEHDIDECAMGTATCGPQAICQNTEGAYTCNCLSTFYGDGVNCVDSAYAVYSIVDFPTTYPSSLFINALTDPAAVASKPINLALSSLKEMYAKILTTFLPESMLTYPGFVMNTTQMAIGYTNVSVDSVFKLKTRMELVTLFPSYEIAKYAAEKTATAGVLATTLSKAFFNDNSVLTVFQQPKTRKHSAYSFNRPNIIDGWGMNITGISYNRTCVVKDVTPTGGCWQVEMIYIGGPSMVRADENPALSIHQTKNVLYLPRIDHDPTTMELTNPSQLLTESSGISFPCSTDSASAAGLGITRQATACCFRDFASMYRPHAGFSAYLASNAYTSAVPSDVCNSQAIFNDTYPNSDIVYTNTGAEGETNDLVVGKLEGMPHSEVRLLETIDYTTRTFRVLLVLEEGDLRTSASSIQGTLGLDYNLTFFVGMVNFKGTEGGSVVSTKTMQQYITVTKSNMLTISSYGANQDPLVSAIDMQLVRVKVTDFFRPITYLYYLQPLFTMPSNFKSLPSGSGIVPLESIRIIKTQSTPSATDVRWMQACGSADGNYIYANATLQQLVNKAQTSKCVQNYLQMCAPPASASSLVTFGIPLPLDLITMSDLSSAPPYSLQVQFVVQAFDTIAKSNVLTSLSLAIDLSTLGLNSKCESLTASQTLADIVSGNIYIGTAVNDYEWDTVLLKKVNMDVPGAAQPSNSLEFSTVTVQGSIMTFSALGDPSYFLDPRAATQSLNINDIYSINFLEPLGGKTGPSPNYDAVKVLFLAGKAFDLKTDPITHNAWLEPSSALLDICPLTPSAGHMVCLTRVHTTMSNNVLKRNAKDVVEIRPGDATSEQEMQGLMSQVLMQGGTNAFTNMMGTNFSNQLINKLKLNSRFRKAYVINPLVDWSYQAMQSAQPRSTAFTVCTKIIAIGLITINSGAGGQLARRLLSTTMDYSPSVQGSGSLELQPYASGDSNPYMHSGRALLQVSPEVNPFAPTPTQSGNSLVLNVDIPGYDSVTHLCNILVGVSYDKCNVLQIQNQLSGDKAVEYCTAHANGVLGDMLSNTFKNTLMDPSGLSQIVGLFVLDYNLQGCDSVPTSQAAVTQRRLLQTDPLTQYLISMKANVLLGSLNGTSILSLDRMDVLGTWLNTTIFTKIVAGGGFVTALELTYLPGAGGKPGSVQVVIRVQNSSSFNETLIKEKLNGIGNLQDIMISGVDQSRGLKSNSASSKRALGSRSSSTVSSLFSSVLILCINALTVISISTLFYATSF